MRHLWRAGRTLFVILVGAVLALAVGSPAGALAASTPAIAVQQVATSAYDTPAYAYDAPARLASPDTATTGARGSSAGPGAGSRVAPVSVPRRGDAANTADDVAPTITAPYVRPSGATTPAQRAAVQGQPCVDCGATTARQVADHIDPLVREYYRTGTIDVARMRSLDAVQPQCPTCSARQGADLSRYSREMRQLLGLDP